MGLVSDSNFKSDAISNRDQSLAFAQGSAGWWASAERTR
jgi:hypothetical protein